MNRSVSNEILHFGGFFNPHFSCIKLNFSTKIIALDSIKLNKNLKVSFDYFDPHFPIIYKRKKKIYSIKNLKYISKYNIVILVTNHSNLPYKKILNDSKILVDTRGQFKNINKSNLYNF